MQQNVVLECVIVFLLLEDVMIKFQLFFTLLQIVIIKDLRVEMTHN